MVRFLCMFFPPVIAVVITEKLRKKKLSYLQYFVHYILFTLTANTVAFFILSFLFDPHWISSNDVFSTSFSAKYSLLLSLLSAVSAYVLEFARKFKLSPGNWLQKKAMIKGLGHFTVKAKNIEESVTFYRNLVGLREAFRVKNSEERKPETVFMYIAPSQFIEISPLAGEDSQTAETRRICIEVTRAAQFLEEFRARGGPIDRELETSISGGIHFQTHDPDNNEIEFMELPPESLQAKANERILTEEEEEREDEETTDEDEEENEEIETQDQEEENKKEL